MDGPNQPDGSGIFSLCEPAIKLANDSAPLFERKV
jgi:hypothetical protein